MDVEEVEEPQNELDASILAILGEEYPPENSFGPAMHKDLAARWVLLLKNGLTGADQDTLIKRYPPSENCRLLGAPKLNPEVAAISNEQVSRRDQKLRNLQNQLGAALSALGQLLTAFLSEEGGGNLNYIRLASDASRLLLDMHNKQSVTRRELINLNIKKDLKDTLTQVPVDDWLFGDKLGDRVRATKDLEKSSLALKPLKPRLPSKNSPLVQRKNLNIYRPPRAIQQGQRQGGRQHTQAPYQRSEPRRATRPPIRKRPRVETRQPLQTRDPYRT